MFKSLANRVAKYVAAQANSAIVAVDLTPSSSFGKHHSRTDIMSSQCVPLKIESIQISVKLYISATNGLNRYLNEF